MRVTYYAMTRWVCQSVSPSVSEGMDDHASEMDNLTIPSTLTLTRYLLAGNEQFRRYTYWSRMIIRGASGGICCPPSFNNYQMRNSMALFVSIMIKIITRIDMTQVWLELFYSKVHTKKWNNYFPYILLNL